MKDTTPADRTNEEPTREGGEPMAFELESPPGSPTGATVPARRKGFLTRMFRRRSHGDIQAVQAGYAELMGVMHSIKDNLELQTSSQSRLLDALDHFPEAVDGLKSLGKIGEQQEQTLTIVRKQVEESAQQGRELIGSIHRFDKTLNLMDDTSRHTSQTMEGLAERSRESEDVLRTMLERSERRLTFLLGAMGLLTIVVIGGVLFLAVGG